MTDVVVVAAALEAVAAVEVVAEVVVWFEVVEVQQVQTFLIVQGSHDSRLESLPS